MHDKKLLEARMEILEMVCICARQTDTQFSHLCYGCAAGSEHCCLSWLLSSNACIQTAEQDRHLTQTNIKIDTELAGLKTMLESHKLDTIKYLAGKMWLFVVVAQDSST